MPQTTQWKITLPTNLAEQVTKKLPVDPYTKEPQYGARRNLICRLLIGWLDQGATPQPLERSETLSNLLKGGEAARSTLKDTSNE